MDYRESEEQVMLRQTVHKFAENEVRPVSVEFDKKLDPRESFSWELLKKASALGLRTMSVPAEYGGGGIHDLVSQIIVMEELGAGDNGFASCIRQTVGIISMMNELCTKEQKDEFYPKIVADDTYSLGIGTTEPNSGTDNILMTGVPGAGIQTFAVRRGDEYIVNGTKHFISNGGMAKLYWLQTRTDKKLPISQCMTVLLVPSDSPGFSIGSVHNKMGRRLLMNAELVFEDMRIPARYLVGKEGEAGKYRSISPYLSFLLCGTTLGTLRRCYEACVEHARTRIQGGKPIIQHQLIAAHLSEMRVRIEAGRALAYRQAWCWQNKYEYDPKLTLLLRTYIDQMGGHIVFQMNDIFGGMGSDRDMVIQKYTRDLFTAFHGPSIGSGLISGAPDWTPELANQ